MSHADDEMPTGPIASQERRGQRLPRSSWLILGLAAAMVLAFVIANPAWFRQSPDKDELRVSTDRHFQKTLAGLGDPDGVWLTADAPTKTFTVALPIDSGPTRTRLRLRGSTQVAQDSTVFLQVYLDGQQVSEEQLPRGDHQLNNMIDIPGGAAADGEVRVHIRTRGMLAQQTCTADQSPGMVIHLDPTTSVEAALEKPIHTVRDALAGLDSEVAIVVADRNPEWVQTAATVGMALTQAGHLVTYLDAIPGAGGGSDAKSWIMIGDEQALSEQFEWDSHGDGEDSIRVGHVGDILALAVVQPHPAPVAAFLTTPARVTGDSAQSDPLSLVATTLSGDQVGLAQLGVDLSQTQIADSRGWRVPFSLADLPGGRLPQSVRLALALPASPDDLTWLLNVSFNGRLIESRRLARASSDEVVIPLPPDAQMLRNELSIEVSRDRDIGGCGVRITTYPIQLLPESALILGDDPGAGFTALPREFARGWGVDAGDSADLAVMLTNVVPVMSQFVRWDVVPEFRWNGTASTSTPFVAVGAFEDVDVPVSIDDGRLTKASGSTLDISSVNDGVVVQCASGPAAHPGLSIQVFGRPGRMPTPTLGRECVRVITPAGHLELTDAGAVRVDSPARDEPAR